MGWGGAPEAKRDGLGPLPQPKGPHKEAGLLGPPTHPFFFLGCIFGAQKKNQPCHEDLLHWIKKMWPGVKLKILKWKFWVLHFSYTSNSTGISVSTLPTNWQSYTMTKTSITANRKKAFFIITQITSKVCTYIEILWYILGKLLYLNRWQLINS